ncbi:hypothetical protein DEU38_12412 [Rhodococcus sp. AG1013]|uniref:hypothetical protein n=1 Tax=Rhodococcus sp. AG1013 TaxID=2183996 RepID=UPI000E0BDBC9|nr:hypothetical protein [Rhodococcus sp. AG1013]RDI16887.1 hypothetical protein DEU38_12412 [Rhodococcus sp. AG1013]
MTTTRPLGAVGAAMCALVVAACSQPPPATDGPEKDAGQAVFRVKQGPIPRGLPEIPSAPAGTPIGAAITLEGMWSGTARTDDPSAVTCRYDSTDGRREYSVVSHAARDHHGSDNYPRADYYGATFTIPGDTDADGNGESGVGAVIFFADEAGNYVQSAPPDADSIAARTSADNRVLTFSMINAPADKRDSGRPTTAVGTISCPN